MRSRGLAEKLGGHLAELTIVRGDDGASDSIRVAFVRGVAKSDLLAMMNELRSVVGVLEIRT
ncbi:MAG: hypothetical protein ABI218_13290 [Caldimonas sp.]